MKKPSVTPATIEKAKINLAKNTSIDITVDWNSVFVRNGSYAVKLQCNCCGNSSERSTKRLAAGKFECTSCLIEKLKTLCTDLGYTYLNHKSNLLHSSCNTCKSVLLSNTSTLQKGHAPRCVLCLNNKYSRLADNLNFDFICKDKPRESASTLVTLRCRKDAAETTITSGELVAGYVACRECQLRAYRIALTKKNCIFISVESKLVGTRIKARVTYQNLIGEIFEATSSNILNGKFATVKDTHWYEKQCVYLISTYFNGETYFKIGTATNAENRLKTLKLPETSTVVILASFDTRFKASNLEVALHQEFVKYAVDPSIPSQFTQGTKLSKRVTGAKVRIKEGITEWFTHEVYDILKTRYNLTEGSANGS